MSKTEASETSGDLAFLDSAKKAYVEGVNPAELDSFLSGLGTLNIGDLQFHGVELYRPQGSRRALPIIETLREVIPSYLLKLIALTGGADGPIGRQFISRPDLEQADADPNRTDWLEEDEYIPEDENGPVEGLTHKYGERVLATFTYDCGAYCRFCTRGRRVGGELHTLPKEKIDRALGWIERNSKKNIDDEAAINEVILSGGDPLAMEPQAFLYVTQRLGEMQRAGKIDLVRIGTRLPIHNPYGMKPHHYEGIKNLENPNVMLHINHPCEITADFLAVAKRLQRDCGALLRSQSVLLQGVNDDAGTMKRLMKKLVNHQIVPYYVFLNDRNFWNDHFTVTLSQAREIFRSFRKDLTGLAGTLSVVIDTGHGRGKVPIPIGEFWDYDPSQFRDYDGRTFSTR